MNILKTSLEIPSLERMLKKIKLKILSSIEILRRLLRAKVEWRYKKPLQKFDYLYGIGRMALSKVKIPTFEKDQTVNWFSYFGFMYSGVFNFLLICTGIYCIIKGKPSKLLPSTIMFTVCLGVSVWLTIYLL